MELTRRTFGKLIAAAGLATVSGAWRLTQRVLPRRVLRAVKAKMFPGRLRPLKAAEIKKPGRWRG